MNINNEYLASVVDEINLMVAVISIDNTLISANKALLDFAHVSLEEIKGIAYWELPWWQHSAELQNMVLFAMGDSYFGNSSRFEASHEDHQGKVHEIDFIIKPVMEDGEPQYFIAMGYNVTDLVSTRKELTQRDRQIKAFFDYSSEGYFFLSLPDVVNVEELHDDTILQIIDKFTISSKNNRLCEIVNRDDIDEKNILKSIGLNEDELTDVFRKIIIDGSIIIQTEIYHDSLKKNLSLTIAAIYNDAGAFEGSFGIVRDITSEVNHINDITYLANKDPLTGLNNRRNFFKESYLLSSEVKKQNKDIYVAMLDIDHFKKVNDTYGHDAGDVVIKGVADILNTKLSDDYVTGRYGGEEFVIVLSATKQEAEDHLNRLRELIEAEVFEYEDLKIRVTISCGFCDLNNENSNLELTLSKADKSLYESKQNGRNKVTFYVDELHGPKSIDEVTGVYIEPTILYNLMVSINESVKNNNSVWVLYFNINTLKENDLIDVNRHLLTLVMCMKKAIRVNDQVGRYGENGFILLLKNINNTVAETVENKIINNTYLGFSGMLNDIVTIDYGKYECKNIEDVDVILNKIISNKKQLKQ